VAHDDAFAFKLNAAGGALVYSTYLGAMSPENATRVVVDDTGSAYITGYTRLHRFSNSQCIQLDPWRKFRRIYHQTRARREFADFSTFFGAPIAKAGQASLSAKTARYTSADTRSRSISRD
jgi:hypothetical protein